MEDDSDDRDDTKRRSRNLSEKKRRDQFNSLVNDLNALISTTNRKMDKSTVLKSTIAFLKHHNEAADRSKVYEIEQDWKPSFLSNDEFTQLMLESLDGFIMAFNTRGFILYASDSITAQLGYLPCDLLKMTIFDLAYEMDHENLFNIFLNSKPTTQLLHSQVHLPANQISFQAHLKRGGFEGDAFNSYETVKFVGHFRTDNNLETIAIQNTQANLPRIFQMNPTSEIDKKLIFVGTGRLQMPQLLREITVIDPTCNEFISKHSMEWKFLFLDQRAPPIIGYMPFEVLGTSGYDYYHFDDLDSIVNCHEKLMQTGKVKSGYYRFLTKGQQWIWLQTDSFVSYNQCNAKPEYVHCTHSVIDYTDVLKHYKKEQKSQIPLPVSTTTADSPNINNVADNNTSRVTDMGDGGGNVISTGILSNETSPNLETPAIWTNTSPQTATESAVSRQINSLKISRPASSYGNISSTGISPNVKRKRYFYNNQGNESDSTSMSADSATSRHSLMTHLSSRRQRHLTTMNNRTSNSQMSSIHHHHAQPQQQQQHHVNSHINSAITSQHHNSMPVNGPHGGQQKLVPILTQHATANTTPIMANSTFQFSQPAFPLRSPQLVGTAAAFLEPSQYITAIPMQPVITPCPVAPILQPIRNQTDMLSGTVVMTPTQTQLQEQLQRKHDELQKIIMQQQDELRIVSEQLLLARYTLLQPIMSMDYSSTAPPNPSIAPNNNRNYIFNDNAVDPQQFNQYGFDLNGDQVQNQQQQLMMQQTQHLPQQHVASNNQETHVGNVALQQQQQQQITVQSHTTNIEQQQQLLQQDGTQQQQQQQLLTSRSVPDLVQFAQEEFDAFLNLSPLHSLGDSQPGLSQLETPINNNSDVTTRRTTHPSTANVNESHVATLEVNTQTGFQTNPTSSNQPTNTNEDSLLSYMQIDTSPNLNFALSINNNASTAAINENSKLLQPTATNSTATNRILTTQTQPRGGQTPDTTSHTYFTNHSFPNLNNPTTSNDTNNNASINTVTANIGNSVSNRLPNNLEILPYEMSEAQTQQQFDSLSHAAGSRQ